MRFTDLFVAPRPLLIYDVLNVRKSLSPYEKQHYERLQKGFAGEKRLATFINEGNYEALIPLYDSLFAQGGTEFQIDCLLLTGDALFLLEVKNYTNDYYFKNGRIYNYSTKKEIYNPNTQLERTEYLFNNLLNDMQINMNVRPYVVFINPEFMLYGAIPGSSMIFPTQVKRFLRKINANSLPPNDHTLRLAEALVERRQDKSAYEQIPEYEWADLKQGIFCNRCAMKLVREGRLYFVCKQCGNNYKIDDVLLDTIHQFHLLFPKKKVSTENIYQWCAQQLDKRVIRRVLKENFKVVLHGPQTHYTLD